jgi:hypothetical protein
VSIARELKQLTALEARFVALALFISLFSVQALGWLSIGRFIPINVFGGGGVCLLLTIVLWRKYAPHIPAMMRGEWVLIAIAVCGLTLRSNPSPFIFGGQDPGVYANMASYFAQHGTAIIKDPLLEELRDDPTLRNYYTLRSMRRPQNSADRGWTGQMVPGIYLQDVEKNQFNPQFYYLSPALLAVGQWVVGAEWQGLTTALLSSLTVLAAGLLTFRLARSYRAAALAAALLAVNPSHSYIATFPVSEGPSGFFFLAGVFFMTARLQYLSVLPFFALFLTRITGFITLPLLLLALAWSAIKRRDPKALRAGLGYIAAYSASYYWGLTFSRFYSQDIYRGKFGIPVAWLDHFWILGCLMALGWIVFCIFSSRKRSLCTTFSRFIFRWGLTIAGSLLVLLMARAIFKGYLLGFTDHYVGHNWLDKRWGAAHHGFNSMRLLSLHTIAVMLSYTGAAGFLLGLPIIGKLGVRRAELAPIGILAGGFLAVFSIQPLITPYLYYFGRYLVSELLPLATVCGAIATHRAAQHFPRSGRVVYLTYLSVVVISLLPSCLARLSLREGKEFYDGIACIAQATSGKSVIFVDKRSFAEGPIVTPLRLSFNKAVFPIHGADFSTAEKQDALFEYFTRKGFSVFLLSAQRGWSKAGRLEQIGHYPMIMRTIGGKGSQPIRVRKRNYPVYLYALGNKSPAPAICKKVAGYV